MAGDRLVDRRTFLHGSATLAAVSGLGVLGPAISARAGVMDDPVPVELFPFRMAMHVHACFSEGDASMEAHLQQAELNGIDVIWWTEHDHRMVARSYLTQVHFNGVSEYTNGTSLTWRSRFEGALASSSASFITSPVSPNDLGGRSLELTAKTSGSSSGTRRLVADVKSYGLNTSIVGTTLSIDVLPRTVGLDAWSDIRLRTSYRPARGGRTAGEYTIIYRVGGSRPVGSRKLLDPLTSLVVVDAPVDVWTTLLLDPVTDLNTFWPGVDFRDSALLEFSLAATSRSGTTSQVVFDELTVARAGRERDVVMATQQEFVDAYASQFPTVTQYRGMEMSESTPHLGWLGNPQIWLVGNPANQDVALAVQRIHEGGGVASYNHPYGSSGGPYSSSQRTTKRRSITSTLVSEALFGADILEVGYMGGRAGMAMSDYFAIWDVLSRNAIFATGNGTSDDHNGRDWDGIQWRCSTGVWSEGLELASLQSALAAGRAWFADMAAFSGNLDLLAEGYVGMGQAAVVDQSFCAVDIRVSAIPSDWSIALIAGVVDEVGPTDPDPLVTQRTFAASEMVDGTLSIKVTTSVSRFYRVELRDAGGVARAFSNPIWLLRALPSRGIPANRLAEPPVTPPPPA